MTTSNPHAKPSRLPILLSAAAYPGIGQFMQRRPGAGMLYAVCFTFFVGLFFVVLFNILKQTWGEFDAVLSGQTVTPTRPSLRPLLVPGGYALFIYLANLYDVYWSYLKHRAVTTRPPDL